MEPGTGGQSLRVAGGLLARLAGADAIETTILNKEAFVYRPPAACGQEAMQTAIDRGWTGDNTATATGDGPITRQELADLFLAEASEDDGVDRFQTLQAVTDAQLHPVWNRRPRAEMRRNLNAQQAPGWMSGGEMAQKQGVVESDIDNRRSLAETGDHLETLCERHR